MGVQIVRNKDYYYYYYRIRKLIVIFLIASKLDQIGRMCMGGYGVDTGGGITY